MQIYEQLHGRQPLELLSTATAALPVTKASVDASADRMELQPEELTPSQLLGFDIAEV
jgi:hypothetical protein